MIWECVSMPGSRHEGICAQHMRVCPTRANRPALYLSCMHFAKLVQPQKHSEPANDPQNYMLNPQLSLITLFVTQPPWVPPSCLQLREVRHRVAECPGLPSNDLIWDPKSDRLVWESHAGCRAQHSHTNSHTRMGESPPWTGKYKGCRGRQSERALASLQLLKMLTVCFQT